MSETATEASFDSTPSRYSLRKLPRIDYATQLSGGGGTPKHLLTREGSIVSERSQKNYLSKTPSER
jgi:hypothetical protein